MIPTPTLSHLTSKDFLSIYEPAEDTFLLLDALEADALLLQSLHPRLVVEIGSGSGCVSAFIGKILCNEAVYLCTDINPKATQGTVKTGHANGVELEAVQSHMLESLAAKSTNKIDLLVFNPPYVPTTAEEEMAAQQGANIEGSWAGGLTGTRLLDGLIDGDEDRGGVETLLDKTKGLFYFVAVKANQPQELVQRLRARGLEAEVVLQRRAGREHLFIVRARWPRGDVAGPMS